MPKINQEEYEVLKGLDEKWKWIARDEDRGLYAFTEKPVRKYDPSSYWWVAEGWDAEPYSAFDLFDEIHLFQFIQWEDEEPYNIAELIKEYEYSAEHVSHVVNERVKALGKAWSESEETEVKSKQELIGKWESAIESAEFYGKGKEERLISYMKDFVRDLNQLDEPEPQNITLQDIMHRLWKLPLNNRKYWLEQLNDEFQEGYIVPLGLKTTDGEEQYLTLNGSYFASRRNRYLQQTFATLEEIPEFYRDLAERVL